MEKQSNNSISLLLKICALAIALLAIYLFVVTLNVVHNYRMGENYHMVILPVYIFFYILSFAAIAVLISSLLSEPSINYQWIVDTVRIMGVLMLCFAVLIPIYLITNNEHLLGRNSGSFTIVFILVNATIGLVCIGGSKLVEVHINHKKTIKNNNESFCTSCGHKLQNKQIKFCANCGEKVIHEAVKEVVSETEF